MTALNHLKRMTKRSMQRVGRGQSSGRGKQSGRGGKGQTARAGAKIRPEWRDIIKKLPKRRGYGKNRGRTVDGTRPDAFVLSLTLLDQLFETGATISSRVLMERGVLGRKTRLIKIVGPSTALGAGRFAKKLTIKGISVSTSARTAIEKAGGSIS